MMISARFWEDSPLSFPSSGCVMPTLLAAAPCLPMEDALLATALPQLSATSQTKTSSRRNQTHWALLKTIFEILSYGSFLSCFKYFYSTSCKIIGDATYRNNTPFPVLPSDFHSALHRCIKYEDDITLLSPHDYLMVHHDPMILH